MFFFLIQCKGLWARGTCSLCCMVFISPHSKEFIKMLPPCSGSFRASHTPIELCLGLTKVVCLNIFHERRTRLQKDLPGIGLPVLWLQSTHFLRFWPDWFLSGFKLKRNFHEISGLF